MNIKTFFFFFYSFPLWPVVLIACPKPYYDWGNLFWPRYFLNMLTYLIIIHSHNIQYNRIQIIMFFLDPPSALHLYLFFCNPLLIPGRYFIVFPSALLSDTCGCTQSNERFNINGVLMEKKKRKRASLQQTKMSSNVIEIWAANIFNIATKFRDFWKKTRAI